MRTCAVCSTIKLKDLDVHPSNLTVSISNIKNNYEAANCHQKDIDEQMNNSIQHMTLKH